MRVLAGAVIPVALAFNGSFAYGADDCAGLSEVERMEVEVCAGLTGDSEGEGELSAQTLNEIKELHARMRYFMAIGMHPQSRKKRDEIKAIYVEHKIPVPREYLGD